jgi:pentafunctional AROM polypeptide
MAESIEPTMVPILGKPSIVVHHGLFTSGWIAQDLLAHLQSSVYVVITDSNLSELYVPQFRQCFERCAKELKSSARLLVYQVPPGEQSKSRVSVGQPNNEPVLEQ